MEIMFVLCSTQIIDVCKQDCQIIQKSGSYCRVA